jgi:uncharacterized protein (DUF885 family)
VTTKSEDTKTGPTPEEAMAQLEALEADARQADENARAISQQINAARADHEALDGERYRLLRDRPELKDHNEQPTDPKNDLAKLEARRSKLPDVDDLQRQYSHARTIEDRCHERIREYQQGHYDQLVLAQVPRAEDAASQLHDALDQARAAAEHYLGVKNRSEGLTHGVPDVTNRMVPGDDISHLLRALQGWELPPPVQPSGPQPQAVIMFPDDRPEMQGWSDEG